MRNYYDKYAVHVDLKVIGRRLEWHRTDPPHSDETISRALYQSIVVSLLFSLRTYE